MNKSGENGGNLSQVVLGSLAALVSVCVVLGSLLLAFTEGVARQALVRTPTLVPTSVLITPLPAALPGQPTVVNTLTETVTLTPACQYPEGWVAYTATADDSLDSLAKAYGVSLDALLTANCLHTAMLFPGLIIYVPIQPTEPPSETPEPEPSDTPEVCVVSPPAGWTQYIVKRGDTLYALSVATGTTVYEIRQHNCLGSTNIQAGQTLYLPAMPPTATLEPTAAIPSQPAAAQLSLVKTANTANFDQPGDTLSYSYQLQNTGNVPISGTFSVSDNKAAVNCPQPASLSPGASITCTGSYSVNQADLDAGSVTNTATAQGFYTGSPVNSNTASKTVNAVQSPALNLDKSTSSSNYSAPGNSLSYSYQLTNTGNVSLSGPFTVSDDSNSPACPGTGTLAPGASLTCTGSYSVIQADLDAGSVTNTATAQGFFGGNAVTSNGDSVTVNANQNAALGLTKSALPTSFTAAGEQITYTYVLTNSGNVTLTGPFSITDDKVSVTCPQPGSLAPNGTVTCSAPYTITAADVTAGQVTNTASASASFDGSPVSSGNKSVTVNGP